MKSLDIQSLVLGVLVTVILLACTDAQNPSPIAPEVKVAAPGEQNAEIGRYVFHSSSPTHILDSTTGTVYYGAQFDEGPWKKHHWLEGE